MSVALETKIEILTKQLDSERAINLRRQRDVALIMKIVGRALPKNNLDPEINILTAKALIEQELSSKGLIIKFNEMGSDVIKQKVGDVEVDYYLDNKKVDLSSFVDATLKDKKFIDLNASNPDTRHDDINSIVYQLAEQRVPTTPNVVAGSDGQLREVAGGLRSNSTITEESKAKLKALGL
jgi:hypothetical protein